MSTETPVATSPDAAAALRAVAVMRTRFSLSNALKSFAATPEDRLDYKPSETAMSPRELICHLLNGNCMLGGMLGIAEAPDPSMADRETLAARLESSTEAIIAAIEAMPTEKFDTSIEFGPNPIPMSAFIFLQEWHLARHAGQLDYLQTTWGDLENRF